jgi:hypothetical protein
MGLRTPKTQPKLPRISFSSTVAHASGRMARNVRLHAAIAAGVRGPVIHDRTIPKATGGTISG